MADNFVDLIPFLSSSGLAGVNVYLLFRVLAVMGKIGETQAAMLEYLRHHNLPE